MQAMTIHPVQHPVQMLQWKSKFIYKWLSCAHTVSYDLPCHDRFFFLVPVTADDRMAAWWRFLDCHHFRHSSNISTDEAIEQT
jgi:hypothetical protein